MHVFYAFYAFPQSGGPQGLTEDTTKSWVACMEVVWEMNPGHCDIILNIRNIMDHYAFYAFYAWWFHFPQSGALAEGTSLPVSCKRGMADAPSHAVAMRLSWTLPLLPHALIVQCVL
jgi:hypothetical protein